MWGWGGGSVGVNRQRQSMYHLIGFHLCTKWPPPMSIDSQFTFDLLALTYVCEWPFKVYTEKREEVITRVFSTVGLHT